MKELSSNRVMDGMEIISGLAFERSGAILETMTDMITWKNSTIHTNAVRYTGSILSSESKDIPLKLTLYGVLDKVINVLYSSNNELVKEALWVLSNINSSGPNYCEQFVKSSAMERCLNLARSHNIDLMSEALWALTNAITIGSDMVRRAAFLYEHADGNGEVVRVLVKGLKVKNEKLLENILEALMKLLLTDEIFNVQGMSSSVYQCLHDLNLPNQIDFLSQHPQQSVFELAQNIHELYMHYDNQFGDMEYTIDDQMRDVQEEVPSNNQIGTFKI